MKKILVPTDFSAPSKASFRFAVELAARAHADVYVVHMIRLPFLPETTFGVQPYPSDPALLENAIQAAHRHFEEMKKQFPSEARLHFNTIHDEVIPGIQAFIEAHGIDQVVMSTHGATWPEDFFIGTTAEKTARVSPVPVISLPKETRFEWVRSIVFPGTLELDQDDLVNDLKALQQLLNARLHVLLINTPHRFFNTQESVKALETFARHYDLHDFTLNVRNHQDERSGILEFMNEVRGDMIAMATHGRTGFAHLFKGSIAEAILNRIDHPIWTRKLRKKRATPAALRHDDHSTHHGYAAEGMAAVPNVTLSKP